MSLSEDRQIYLAHLIFNFIYDEDLADFKDEDLGVRAAKKGVAKYVAFDEKLRVAAAKKVQTLKRGVLEGSPEWDILFKKYYEEERGRHGKS